MEIVKFVCEFFFTNFWHWLGLTITLGIFGFGTVLIDKSHNTISKNNKEEKRNTQPQNIWKPSDEQMEALKQAKTDACGKPYFNTLASLYVNLKGY